MFRAVITLDPAESRPAALHAPAQQYPNPTRALVARSPPAAQRRLRPVLPGGDLWDSGQPLHPGDRAWVTVTVTDDGAYFDAGQRFALWSGGDVGHGTIARKVYTQYSPSWLTVPCQRPGGRSGIQNGRVAGDAGYAAGNGQHAGGDGQNPWYQPPHPLPCPGDRAGGGQIRSDAPQVGDRIRNLSRHRAGGELSRHDPAVRAVGTELPHDCSRCSDASCPAPRRTCPRDA